MIINKYKGIRSLFWNNIISSKGFYFITRPVVKHKEKIYARKTPLFCEVEIETVNRCNGICPFCPVNRLEKQRPFARMSDELFDKIISQLGEMDYCGNLALFSNNEPFLDKRIIEFAKRAREKVPGAFIHLYSNGTLLDTEKITEIMPYLNRLIIDNYSDELILDENIKQIDDLCRKDPILNRKIEIHLRLLNEKLYSRGGSAPNKKIEKTFYFSCLMPYRQLVIRPDGKVSLCCNDALGKMTLGDCNDSTLKEIWYGETYKRVREKLKRGRCHLDICRFCDTFSASWIKIM